MKPYFQSPERILQLQEQCYLWLGTPFHKGARLCGIGADCVQSVAAIYIACKLVQDFNPPAYTLDGGKHNNFSMVVDYVEATGRFQKVSLDSLQPGDLLCLLSGRVAHHVGIFLGGSNFFHAIEIYGCQINSLQDSTWRNRLIAVYRPIDL